MSTQAKWSDMKWTVNKNKVIPIASVSGSRGISVERNEDKEGKKATQTVAYDLMTLSVEYTVVRSVTGENPTKTYKKWMKRLGVYAPFYLGGKRFMAKNFMLKKCDCSDLVLAPDGDVVSMGISLEFEEYSENKSGLKKETGGKATLKAGVGSSKKKSAKNVGKTSSSKSSKIAKNKKLKSKK